MDIQEIRSKIVAANAAYYNRSESTMTDEEYDSLKDQLKELSPNDPLLYVIGAPPDKHSPWEKYQHTIPMGSLNKVTNLEEFQDWSNSVGEVYLTLSEKLDGASVAIEYENGILQVGATRGDGTEGEDITDNVVKMQGVKIEFDESITGSLRGEIILEENEFNLINQMLEAEGKDPLANKRNGAAGIARSRDGRFAPMCKVKFYEAEVEGKVFSGKYEVFDFLEKLGLETSLVQAVIISDDVYNWYTKYEESRRNELTYEIDGLVIEVDDLRVQDELGEAYGNRKGAVALKFGAAKANTELVDIEKQLGNSGRITHVAIMKPVHLAGATVRKASLHNLEMASTLRLGVGDIIEVSRRNDVIPYVERVVERKSETPIDLFGSCPVCGGAVEVDGKFLLCANPNCKGKEIGNLKKWVKTLDLKGIADKTIEKLYEENLVRTPGDFYKVSYQQMVECGFGKRQSEIIYNILNDKKKIKLPEFVGGLNLPDFGKSLTEKLMSAGHDSLDKVMNLTVADLVGVEGIGQKTAEEFVTNLIGKQMVIAKLLQAGVTIENPKAATGKLAGKSFVFTGAMSKPRKELQAFVVANGGEAWSGVKKGLTYLVQSDKNSTSNKSVKAKKYGVEIINEDEFLMML